MKTPRTIHDQIADLRDEKKALLMAIGVLLFIIGIMYVHFVWGVPLGDPSCTNTFNCGL